MDALRARPSTLATVAALVLLGKCMALQGHNIDTRTVYLWLSASAFDSTYQSLLVGIPMVCGR